MTDFEEGELTIIAEGSKIHHLLNNCPVLDVERGVRKPIRSVYEPNKGHTTCQWCAKMNRKASPQA